MTAQCVPSAYTRQPVDAFDVAQLRATADSARAFADSAAHGAAYLIVTPPTSEEHTK
jgi:hypothetical protein